MKTRISKITGLVLAFILIFAVTGCGAKAAKVNNQTISKSEYDKRLAKQKKLAELNGADLKSEQSKKMLEALGQQVLDGMIDEALVMQAAEKEGVKPKDSEVDQSLKDLKARFKDDKEYKDALKQFNFTEKEMRDYLAYQLTYNQLYDKVTSKVKVSDNDLKKYYESNKTQMNAVKIRVISVASEDDARKIITELKAGKDFARIAREKSTDALTKDSGGLLADTQSNKEYWAKGELEKVYGSAIEDAVFNLKKGELTQNPLAGSGTFFVIKVEDVKALSFEEAKENIQNKLVTEQKDRVFSQYMADFKQKAVIKKYIK